MEQKENKTFNYTYSAKQQDEIQNIRKKYAEPEENKEEDKMEQLRRLDAGVTKKAMSVSITVGVVGTLLLGLGMSLAISDFGLLLGSLAMLIGVITGVVGIALVCCAYPIYNKTIKRERKKITPEILRLTDELMK